MSQRTLLKQAREVVRDHLTGRQWVAVGLLHGLLLLVDRQQAIIRRLRRQLKDRS